MTPAIDLLKKLKIKFNLLKYTNSENAISYGLEAAEKLAVEPRRIFKTLIIELDNGSLAVAIIPVELRLNLKNAAKALKAKKAKMADAKKVQSTKGYVLGGVSPFGQKNRLVTLIDQSAQLFDSIYVSGGKRGLEIETACERFSQLLDAKFFHITAT